MPLDFPSSPTNGQTYENFIFDSSITAWRNQGSPSGLAGQVVALDNKMGLKNVVPSSVVIATGTGSANSIGLVSFTGATAVSLNNIFSSDYINYRVHIRLNYASAVAAIYGRMRKSETDNSSTNYTLQGFFANGTTITNYSNMGTTAMDLSDAVTTGNSVIITDIFSARDYPGYISNSQSALTTSANYKSSMAGFLKVTDTFDGFTIYPGSGSISGTIQVFGYND